MNSFLSELKQWSFANFPEKFAAALPKLIVFIVVIAVGFWLSKLAGNLMVKILESKNVDKSMHRFVNRSTVIFLRIIVAVVALEQVGFNVNSFITALGAAGITAGLGLQNSIAQLAGGIQILFNKPFKSGDFVEIDNVSGKVREIRFMYTTLVTNDNKLVVVPNQKITTSTLINYTARDKIRLDLTYSISYDDDVEKAKKVLKQVIESDRFFSRSRSIPSVFQNTVQAALTSPASFGVKVKIIGLHISVCRKKSSLHLTKTEYISPMISLMCI